MKAVYNDSICRHKYCPKPYMYKLDTRGDKDWLQVHLMSDFLPEASIGLRVLSSPVCVCVSTFFVRAITHLMFQLESSNLDKKIQQILLKVPIVFGVDWPWPSRSNLTSFQNSVYLHRFCVLKYLWDLHENGSFLNCCPAQMIPHICVYTDSNILAEMVVPRTVKQSSCIFGETNAGSCFMCRGDLKVVSHGFSQPSTQRLTLDFTSCYGFSPNYIHLTCRNFMYQQSAIAETTVKQRPLAFILSPSTTALFTSALFLAW